MVEKLVFTINKIFLHRSAWLLCITPKGIDNLTQPRIKVCFFKSNEKFKRFMMIKF